MKENINEGVLVYDEISYADNYPKVWPYHYARTEYHMISTK